MIILSVATLCESASGYVFKIKRDNLSDVPHSFGSLVGLLLQLPRRIATAATIAAASITASGGALVVVGHGVLVRLLFCSP